MSVVNTLLDNLKNYYIEKNQNLKADPKFSQYKLESTKYKIESSYKSDNPHILGRCKVILSMLDTPTQNGTYYSTGWANKTLINNEKFKTKLSKKLVLGETDHPDKADGSIKHVSHAVIDIWIERNEVWGLVEIFNTPMGQILWTLLNAGVVLGVSSRGIGDEYYDGGVKKIKEDNFEMIGWDFVIDASALGAEFKEFTESKKKDYISKMKNIEENYNGNYSKYIIESLIREDKIKESLNKYEEEKNRLNKEIDNHKFYSNKLIEKNTQLQTENNKLKREIEILKQSNLLFSKMSESKSIIENKHNDEITYMNNRIKMLEDEIMNKEMIIDKYKKESIEKQIKSNDGFNNIQVLLSEKKTIKENNINNNGVTNSIKNRTPKYDK